MSLKYLDHARIKLPGLKIVSSLSAITSNKKITHIEAACPEHTVGKYVRIRLKDQNYLALCEVEVHGSFVEDVYSGMFSVKYHICHVFVIIFMLSFKGLS